MVSATKGTVLVPTVTYSALVAKVCQLRHCWCVSNHVPTKRTSWICLAMYFPDPYPDELLGSVFIRASHHLGLTPRALYSALSNRSDGELSFIYPCAIAEVAGLLSMSRREVLLQHTVFPYICIGLDSARRSDLEEQLSESSASSSSLRLRSTFPGHIEALSFRRLCRKCQRYDIETWGEDYWHRIHALPGVLVCPIHGSPLHSSRVPLLAHISPKYNVLPHEVPCDQVGESVNEAQLRTLASEVEAALRPEGSFWDYCLQSCQHAASSCGYEYRAHAKTDAHLAVDFESYFGRSLLGQLGLSLVARSSGGWPVEVLRGRRPAMQLQLRFILLRMFLLDPVRTGGQQTEPFAATSCCQRP